MKRIICGLSAAAVILGCFASCGSHKVSNENVKVTAETLSNRTDEEIIENITGKWQTTVEYINGEDTPIIYKRYDFHKDGSGLYYDIDGIGQQISWSLTKGGRMELVYEEMDGFTEIYDFIGCDMVVFNNTPDGKRESHIAKVSYFAIDVKGE